MAFPLVFRQRNLGREVPVSAERRRHCGVSVSGSLKSGNDMAKEPIRSALCPTDYEHSDVPGKLAGWAGLALAAGVLCVPLLLRMIYPGAYHGDVVSEFHPRGPGPHLQLDERADLSQLRRAETVRLDSYEWINRNDMRVRIPIARALQLTADRGLPGWTKP
jgi:hypothetical protein